MEPVQSKTIIKSIADILGEPPTDLDMDATLREDLSLNPVQMADLYNELSQRFDIVFMPGDTAEVQTVAELVELIEDKLLEV